jgi:hypothetical protein
VFLLTASRFGIFEGSEGVMTRERYLQTRDDFRDLGIESRNVFTNGDPYSIDVHPEVVVDQLVSHPCDVTPGDMGCRVAEY